MCITTKWREGELSFPPAPVFQSVCAKLITNETHSGSQAEKTGCGGDPGGHTSVSPGFGAAAWKAMGAGARWYQNKVRELSAPGLRTNTVGSPHMYLIRH